MKPAINEGTRPFMSMTIRRKSSIATLLVSMSAIYLATGDDRAAGLALRQARADEPSPPSVEGEIQALEKRLEALTIEGKLAEASEIAGQVAKIRERTPGKDRWKLQDARLRAESLARVASRPQAIRDAFVTLGEIDGEADKLEAAGRYAEARPKRERALEIRKEALGEDDIATASSLNNLAANLHHQGMFAESRPMQEKALAIHRKTLGEDHPDTAICYNELAVHFNAQGLYAEARMMHEKALVIRRRVLGENHADTARSYANLASTMGASGFYAEARPLNEKALEMRLRLLGENNTATATSFNNLALNLDKLGRHAEARSMHEKTLTILRKVAGEDHPNTAISYTNLAANLNSQGLYTDALPLLERALLIRQKSSSEGHPDTARIYNNLATTLTALNRSDEARSLLEKASILQRTTLGEVHPARAQILNNLAATLYGLGRPGDAEQVWTEAADSYAILRGRMALTGMDRSIGTGSFSPFIPLATLLARRGEYDAAWKRYEQGLARGLLDDLSGRQSRRLNQEDRTRQQRLFERLNRLDAISRELASNASRRKDLPEALGKLEQERVEAQADWGQFNNYLESTYGAAVGQSYDLAKIQHIIPADTALVGWLDFIPPFSREGRGEHWAVVVRSSGAPRWVALPGQGPGGCWSEAEASLGTRLVEVLSDRSRLDEPIDQAIKELAAQRIRPIEPLFSATSEAPAVRRLIVLPSPGLQGLPVGLLTESMIVSYAPSATIFAWLKEHRRGGPDVGEGARILALGDPTFEVTGLKSPKVTAEPPATGAFIASIVVGSVAQRGGLRDGDVLLSYAGKAIAGPSDVGPVIREVASARDDQPVQVWREGKIVDLALRPGELGARIDDRSAREAVTADRDFDRLMGRLRDGDVIEALPGTRLEIEAIASLFEGRGGRPDRLLGGAASEQALRSMASRGELARYRFLHLATHGVIEENRAFESSLLLARDRLPNPIDAVTSGQEIFDGRLTVAEILQTWTLDADLVALSACRTALGRVIGGEGYLGFAQALFLAGSKTVLLSLWKVDDSATSLLMTRFYANLLGARPGLSGPLPKAEALREAQSWLRNLDRAQVDELLKTTGERGKKVTLSQGPAKVNASVESGRPYSHPYFWAAFVIIGDPD